MKKNKTHITFLTEKIKSNFRHLCSKNIISTFVFSHKLNLSKKYPDTDIPYMYICDAFYFLHHNL